MRRAPGTHPFFISLAALALLTLSSSVFAAEPDRERSVGERVRVERVVKLQPRPEAEVIVPGLKAYFLSDGSVTLSGQGTVRAGSPAEGFDFEVDTLRGTYSTRRLDPAEIEERSRLRDALGEGPQAPPAGESEKPLDSVVEAVTPGTFTGRVWVQTKDPALIVLAETLVGLTWVVSSTGGVSAQSYSDNCWAANPSSLDTHWYVSYCQRGAPYPSSGRVCNDNRGDYYNYDFAFDDAITTASHYVYICGRNDAQYSYNWTYNDGGEGAILIFGSVTTG